MPDFVNWETQSGTPITYRGGKLIPFSQALRIHIPGLSGGLIWNRPVSVLAVDTKGQEQILPVQDVTRQVVWSLWGITLLMMLLGLFIRKRSRTREE
jgi:hypothetical protein